MDGKNNNRDLEQIRNLMGGRFKSAEEVVTPGASHSPGPAPVPTRKQQPAPENKGIKPIFPLLTEEEARKAANEPRKPDDVFAFEKHRTIDKELNELALREVAAERGLTVEDLLKQKPDKKLEEKLEFSVGDVEKQMSVEDVRKMVGSKPEVPKTNSEQILALELKKLQLELEILKGQQHVEMEKPFLAEVPEIKPEPLVETKVEAKPKMEKPFKPQHPMHQKLRQAFALDAIPLAGIEINGVMFQMHPAPSSIHPWFTDKMAAASDLGVNSDQAFAVVIRNATVACSLIAVDGYSLVNVLGLAEEEVKDPRKLSPELRVLLAQTLWEMICELPSMENLFNFNPELTGRLFEFYNKKFRDITKLRVRGDETLHRYVCPVPKCLEVLDIEVPDNGQVYCRTHGTLMDDNGSLEDLRSIPLA